jgi:multisubunit Na+/H+ antiporter MnhC subunit
VFAACCGLGAALVYGLISIWYSSPLPLALLLTVVVASLAVGTITYLYRHFEVNPEDYV